MAWHTAHAVPAKTPISLKADSSKASRPPERIVSLLPSLTENICALGFCKALVGVDDYSNYPDSVNQLPKVGGGLTPNLETILALKPTLVVMGHQPVLADKLKSFGIASIMLPADTMAQYQLALMKLGSRLNTDQAPTVWRELQAQIKAAGLSIPASQKKQRIYFEISPDGFTAGPNSFIGTILTQLGEHNITPTDMGNFVRLTPEYIVRANPQIIIVASTWKDTLMKRSGFDKIDAVKHKKICALTQIEVDELMRPAPRLGLGARALAKCMAAFETAP